MNMGSWAARIGVFGGAWALVVACSSSASGTNSGGCTNDYSGKWDLSGTCTNTDCDVTQNGCSLGVRCADGTTGSGTLNGSSATMSGLLGSGDSGTCTVNFSGASFSMSCQSSRTTTPCTGSAKCDGGSCGKPFPSSSSSSSGGTSVPCRQKADSDTESDCAEQAGRPRKLDCDSGDATNAAVAAGCVPTKPGDSDVCCPLTISGTPSGSSSGVDSGPPGVSCTQTTAPRLFNAVAGKGPGCGSGVRCNTNQKCCTDPGTGSQTCAATCAAGTLSAACYNSGECATAAGGPVCCAKGTFEPTLCSAYPTVRGYDGSVCSTSCRSGEYRACASSADCGGGTCVAAYLLNTGGTATVPFSVGVCQGSGSL